MARVVIRLPAPLREVLATGTLEVEAPTLEGALEEVRRAHPALAVHLFEESGGFRQHVLCFHNGTDTRWMDDLSVPVQEGDELTIAQAVSGG